MCIRKDRSSKWIRIQKRWLLYILHRFTCAYCGRTLEEISHEGTLLSLDHLVPVEHGGTHRADNLVTACRSCNSAKGHMTYRRFLRVLREHGVDTSPIVRRVARQREWGKRVEDRKDKRSWRKSNVDILDIRSTILASIAA